jgi:hypothetical protein
MAQDPVSLLKNTGTGGAGMQSLPMQFGILPTTVETNQNDHQFEFGNLGGQGLSIIVNVSAFAVAASLTVSVLGILSDGTTYPLGATAVLAATGVVVLRFGPSLLGAINASFNTLIPDRILVQTTHGNVNSITYSITGILHPNG